MGNSVNDIDLENWVTVKTAGGGFLGCLHGATISRLAGTSKEDRIEAFKKKVFNVLEDNAGWLELYPAFDFAVPIRPMQHPQQPGRIVYSKDPVCTPVDITSQEITVSVKPSSIVFLVELQGKDKELYKSFVHQTLDMMVRMRAEASGLVMPGGDAPRG
jgi:hypothetical protein